MFSVPTTKEKLLREYPLVQEWFDVISNTFKHDINSKDLELYYTYNFFIPKMDQNNEYYEKIYDEVEKMYYNDRLIFEISKVRVDLTIKIKNFQLTNSLNGGFVPEDISEIITEITKIKMLVEYEFYKNEDIKKSIPELDRKLVSYEIVNDEIIKDITKENIDKIDFNIDDILDKIATNGIESLSVIEKDFLDKKSKDI